MMAKNRTLSELKKSAQNKLNRLAEKESQRSAIHAEIEALFQAAQQEGRDTLTAREQSKLNTLVRQEKESQLTDAERAIQIDQLGVLAAANLKTMTASEARQWADEFTAERSDTQAALWAARMVGHVEAHQENPRGPKTSQTVEEVAEGYLKIIATACRMEGVASAGLSKSEIDRLEQRVNSICDSQFTPRIERRQITQALKQIFDTKGR